MDDDIEEYLNAFRRDNDNGNPLDYFPANEGRWVECQAEEQALLGCFFDGDINVARVWLHNEMETFRGSGHTPAWWDVLKDQVIKIPPIVTLGETKGELNIWDGWHRIAIAMVYKLPLRIWVGKHNDRIDNSPTGLFQ